MNDFDMKIELYESTGGLHHLRVGPRIAHLGTSLRRRTDGNAESVIAKFRDDAQAIVEGQWSLDFFREDGGPVESFQRWDRRTRREGELIKSIDAPERIATFTGGSAD